MPPELIEPELTQRVLMDTGEVTRTLDESRQRGVMLAVGDFGTGYSSLSYLRESSIDCLTMAKPFVDDAPHDSHSGQIDLATINMAQP